MASNFPPPLVLNDLSKDQTTEHVIYKDPLVYEPSLDNTNKSDIVQHQPKPRSMQYVEIRHPPINSRSIHNSLGDEIKTYTTWSVLNILCCCMLIGCCACNFSMITKKLRKHGDIPGALEASKTARMLNIISTALGIIIWVATGYNFYHQRI
jgi:hypothetical protein